jgi:Ca2+-transporting ATPase
MAYGPRLDNLTFAGIIGLEDPPREGVVESVHQLEKGGVKVIMVTGDSKETAIAIARRCGILGGGGGRSIAAIGDEADSCLATMLSAEDSSDDEYLNINLMSSDEYNMDDVEFGQRTLSGAQLDTIGQHNLPDAIVGVKVFYRVAPRHKLALVRALQKNGEVVAMTGDGVNDALSLKVRAAFTRFVIFLSLNYYSQASNLNCISIFFILRPLTLA